MNEEYSALLSPVRVGKVTLTAPSSVANQKNTSVPCGVSRQCRVSKKP